MSANGPYAPMPAFATSTSTGPSLPSSAAMAEDNAAASPTSATALAPRPPTRASTTSRSPALRAINPTRARFAAAAIATAAPIPREAPVTITVLSRSSIASPFVGACSGLTGGVLVQFGNQLPASSGNPRPHGADRHAEDDRGVLIAKTEQLREHQRAAFYWFEPCNELRHADRFVSGKDGGRRRGRQPSLQHPAASAAAQLVRARPVRDRQQPGSGRRLAPKGRQRGDGSGVHVLGHIVRGRGIDEERAQAPDVGLRGAHEVGEGGLVAGSRAERVGGHVVHAPILAWQSGKV